MRRVWAESQQWTLVVWYRLVLRRPVGVALAISRRVRLVAGQASFDGLHAVHELVGQAPVIHQAPAVGPIHMPIRPVAQEPPVRPQSEWTWMDALYLVAEALQSGSRMNMGLPK